MPQGSKHQSRKVAKLLNMGDPGSGKTGALACLLKAGYRVIAADFDNGLDILVNLVRDDKEALDRLWYETFTDRMKMVAGMTRTTEKQSSKSINMIIPAGTPTAFTKAMKGLDRWKFPVEEGSDEMYDLGGAHTWGPDTVLLIDSLGFASTAALHLVRDSNMHQMDQQVSQPDYGQAMDMIERMLQLLYSDSIGCNVIINTHIVYLEDVMKELHGLPRALGNKLPPKVGGYFNTIIRTKTEGQGKSQKRVIKTRSDVACELKLPLRPGTVPDTLPIETGLLTILKALHSEEWVPEEEQAA